jgi:hypothetical protein
LDQGRPGCPSSTTIPIVFIWPISVTLGEPKPASRAANLWNAPYVNAGNRGSFVRELPAGPAVVPPINGSVCAVGRQVL